MKLHTHDNDFRAAVQAAATFHKIPDYVIEKDYWVTKALLKLSNSQQCSGLVVFKGGTSLSKGYSLIKRFSEDIDLALFPHALGKQGLSKNQGQALYKVIQEATADGFEQDNSEKLSEKPIYKRVFKYPTKFNFPPNSVIHPKIVIEATLFGDPAPAETIEISSLIERWLHSQQQQSAISELGLSPFKVLAAKPEKTYCEKALALMKRAEGPQDQLGRRARHFYDLHKLHNSQRINDFINSQASLKEHFIGAAKGDRSYQEIFEPKGFNPSNYKLFQNPQAILESVATEYGRLTEILFNDELPIKEDIVKTLVDISKFLEKF